MIRRNGVKADFPEPIMFYFGSYHIDLNDHLKDCEEIIEASMARFWGYA